MTVQVLSNTLFNTSKNEGTRISFEKRVLHAKKFQGSGSYV